MELPNKDRMSAKQFQLQYGRLKDKVNQSNKRSGGAKESKYHNLPG